MYVYVCVFAYVTDRNRQESDDAHGEQITLQEYGITDTGNSAAHKFHNTLYNTDEEKTLSSEDKYTDEKRKQKRTRTKPQHTPVYAYADVNNRARKLLKSNQAMTM